MWGGYGGAKIGVLGGLGEFNLMEVDCCVRRIIKK